MSKQQLSGREFAAAILAVVGEARVARVSDDPRYPLHLAIARTDSVQRGHARGGAVLAGLMGAMAAIPAGPAAALVAAAVTATVAHRLWPHIAARENTHSSRWDDAEATIKSYKSSGRYGELDRDRLVQDLQSGALAVNTREMVDRLTRVAKEALREERVAQQPVDLDRPRRRSAGHQPA